MMIHVSRLLQQTIIKRDRQVAALAQSEDTIVELEKLVSIDTQQLSLFVEKEEKKKG